LEKFIIVQDLDDFHEAATIVEATTTTDRRVIVAAGQWQLGDCRQSWEGDVLPQLQADWLHTTLGKG
jgi:hypothetical protein